jgi:membrane protease YdiL (CAAX protease family)
MGKSMTRKQTELLLYSLAVLVPTILISVGFSLYHVTNNWAANVLMFIPGIAAVVFRLWLRRGFKTVGWRPGPPIYWLWAVVLPVVALVMSLPISVALGYAAPAPPGSGIAALSTGKIVLNFVLYILISIPLAFGEEFGWRGYAQVEFVEGYGLLRGLFLLGLLWGVWHTPIFYVMGTYPDHPVLGPFMLTPIDNILAVVPMAWLYIRSRSIWVVTFTHAFADVLWGFSGLLFPAVHEVQSWAVLQTVQLVLSVLLFVDLRSSLSARDGGIPAFQTPAVR